MLPWTIRLWVAWLILRSATWAVFAQLDPARWWVSPAYDLLVATAPIRAWGAVWAVCAAGMAAGLILRRVEILRWALSLWLAVQIALTLSVAVLVASGTLTAITAIGHFADSIVATGAVLASGRLVDPGGR